MHATAETVNFEADVAARANLAAPHVSPFDYRDLGSKAVPWAVEQPPTALTPQDLQVCVDAAMARPTVMYAPHMLHAGIRVGDPHHKWQILRGAFEYQALPVNCAPDYLRFSYIKQEMKKSGRWVRIGPLSISGAWGNDRQQATVDVGPTHPTPAFVYDECVNGRFQKDRIVITNILKAGPNGSRTVVAHKEYTINTIIQGSCRAAVQSRKRYGH